MFDASQQFIVILLCTNFRRLSSVFQLMLYLSWSVLDFLFLFSHLNRLVLIFCYFKYSIFSFGIIRLIHQFCYQNIYCSFRNGLQYLTLPVNRPGMQVFGSSLWYWNIRTLRHRVTSFISIAVPMMM